MTVTNQSSEPGTTTPEVTVPTPEPAQTTVLTQEVPPELFDPEKFEYPEVLNREHETFKEFTDYAKEMGMTKAQAEKLIGVHATAVKATMEAIQKQWTDQQAAWTDEIKKDAELGKTDEVRKVFSAIADNPTLSDPKFKEALDFTGAGNHPAVVRTLFRWAKALSEGASISGDPARRDGQGQVTAAPTSAAAAIYGPNGPVSGGPNMRG